MDRQRLAIWGSSRDFTISSAMCLPVMRASLLKLFSDVIYRINQPGTDNRLFVVVRIELISHNTAEPGLFDILNSTLEYDVFFHNF